MKVIPFQKLADAKLIVDAVYEGGSSGNVRDDPINGLGLDVGNQGGIRFAGGGGNERLVVLYTTGEEKDWPDTLDQATGRFVYFGDNRKPGQELHDTTRGGNSLLSRVFEKLHALPPRRNEIPPFFVFTKHSTPNSKRSVKFRGLAVPGFSSVASTEDLIAVWKSSKGQRFQNYRALFTVLDIATLDRACIHSLTANDGRMPIALKPWTVWKTSGVYRPLVAPPTSNVRSIEQQMPENDQTRMLLQMVYVYFTDTPTRFEAFAARIYKMQDNQRIRIDEITRATVDGGRDAIGRYQLGVPSDPIFAKFALEAKCYAPFNRRGRCNTVGVKQLSRLISRIRHREFGVLVTTSAVSKQAYNEVRKDDHPIIILSGKDITDTLMEVGLNTEDSLRNFLEQEFPIA